MPWASHLKSILQGRNGLFHLAIGNSSFTLLADTGFFTVEIQLVNRFNTGSFTKGAFSPAFVSKLIHTDASVRFGHGYLLILAFQALNMHILRKNKYIVCLALCQEIAPSYLS